MKIAIIGGTGFIGQHLTAQLATLDHPLLVFHRGTHPLPVSQNVSVLLGERSTLSAHADTFRRFDPDIVIDVIGYSRRDARELVTTFARSRARVIVLSSVDVYRNRTGFFGLTDFPPDPLPLDENAPLRTRYYPYANHSQPFHAETTYEKLHVEQTVRAGLPGRTTILRLPAVYGPGDHQHRLWPYLQRMLDRRPFILLEHTQTQWPWTRGYVENVGAAIAAVTLSETGRDEIYNVGEAEAPTEQAWIARIANVTGWSGRVIGLPNDALPAHLRTTFNWNYGFAMACEKFRSAFQFTDPVPPDLAMQRTVAWESAHPPSSAASIDYAAEDAAVQSLPR